MSDSVWKKEISFGRKPKQPKAERAAATEPRPKPDSVWKKEISFGRKAKQAERPLAPEPAPQAPAASVTERIAAFVPEAAPPVTEAAPPTDAAPPVEEQQLPPSTGDYGWLTQNFDPNEVPDDMPAVPAPKVALPRVEPPPALPDLPGVPDPAPAATTETAADAPAVAPPPEQRVPFWKKELSFKRGGSKAPRPAKPPKEPKAKKAKKAKKVKEQKASAPTERTEPKEKQPPFWKRELTLGKPKLERRAKAPRAEKQPKTPRAKKTKADRGPTAKGALVGLKIGASQVAAARVSNNGAPELLQVAREPLVDGVVVGGELRDIETLAETLRELFTKHKLPKKNVRLGIANNRIGVRTFELAGIDDQKQLANAIRFRAQETLPIPLEEAVLDWQLLSESTDEETGQLTRRVLLVVAYRELVERYVSACRKAGLQVTGIDLEAFAMLRALNAPAALDVAAPLGAQVVVNVGHDRSTFAVSDGRVCEFTRVLGWGGQSLSVAIARALDCTPSEATPVKHALSLVAQTTDLPEGVTHEALATARDAVTRELQSFARELVSSLRFYQNQPGSLGIAELVLTGGTAHLPGLADELQRLIGVPVRVGDPLNRVVIPKKFREPEYALGSLTIAIGLGIED